MFVETNCTQTIVVNFLQWFFPFLGSRVIFQPANISSNFQPSIVETLTLGVCKKHRYYTM